MSSFISARSDLRSHSPMQMEKRAALDGPYGALANAMELPGSPQVASLLFEPKALALNSEPTFERPPKSASIIEAPLPPPAPVQVASDVPLPLPVSPAVVAGTAPPPPAG